jgi:hypothetical protein
VRSALLALLAAACAAACGSGSGVPDQDLGGLVVARKPADAPIDVEKAAHDPAELGRALMRPFRVTAAALGPHALALETETDVTSAGSAVSQLSDHTSLELGAGSAWHGLYTNSADYGREVIEAASGQELFLRPRYQRWHRRAPEGPDEVPALQDSFASAIAATWDLVAPGAELSDEGPVQFAGRAGRKIAVKLAPTPRAPDAEPLPQRAWREHRRIEALDGDVVLDAEKGVPLAVHLAATIGFQRDGKAYDMKVKLTSVVANILASGGTAIAIAPPAEADTVTTPERLREVDDRDFLLQGMAPPARVGGAIEPGSAAASGGPAK